MALRWGHTKRVGDDETAMKSWTSHACIQPSQERSGGGGASVSSLLIQHVALRIAVLQLFVRAPDLTLLDELIGLR